MTVSIWSGMALADIPAEYFDEPFETWTGKLPALVLASTRTVPVSPHGQWRLASASCGGHREDIFPAAVLQLDICQEMADVVRGSADSAFTEEYLGYFESLPEAERRPILSCLIIPSIWERQASHAVKRICRCSAKTYILWTPPPRTCTGCHLLPLSLSPKVAATAW